MTRTEEPLRLVEQELARCPPGILECVAGEEDGNDGAHLHVRTSLLYPGGGPIHVFVRAAGRDGYTVTDREQSMSMMGRHLSTDTSNTGRWNPIAGSICLGLDIKLQGREWTTHARSPEEVGVAIMALAQAQLRAAIISSIIKITDR